MALGGGIWTKQDKILPGAYTVFSNVKKATASLSDRGVVALPIVLNWGEVGKVQTVSREGFQAKSRELFGYKQGADELISTGWISAVRAISRPWASYSIRSVIEGDSTLTS